MAKKRKVDHSLDRNLIHEGRQGLQLMEEAAPRIVSLQEQFGGRYAEGEVKAAEARSAAETAAIGRQAPAFRETVLKASPEISAANAALMARLGELGPGEIEKEQERQALEELKLGGALTAEEQREASQAARAAWSARGLATSTPAAVGEVLNRVGATEARKAGRRAYASGVAAQGMARKASDAATANNSLNTLGSFWDPHNRIFGKAGSQVSGQVYGPSSFGPYLQAANDVGSGNQRAQLGLLQLDEEARQFDLGLAWDQEAFGMNREDSLAAQSANNKAAKRAGTMQAVSTGLGIAAMAALAFM